ncbi:MAG: bifunctional (p)ppGpp synthetase/guanosine-3',5'-bis(diphosphate) 3'-pyrophosphohydrolase [Magnetococcales bacterium]|nr:bifunctional (p)ppGpp synthetase/guanosine-3',5'-bis(diphosphate) 3'-pyrophosphohydrolase [Magnetococcales bacterium]
MQQWSQLVSSLLTYDPDVDPAWLNRVYDFVRQLPRRRKEAATVELSCSPLAVAATVLRLRLDAESIAAGLLIDGVQQGLIDLQQVREQASPEVAGIIEGVRRVASVMSRAKSDIQAEDIRRMVLAVAGDIRVLLVRLAVSLHQARTAAALPQLPSHCDRIATSILDIYAPIAHRLGIYWIKNELEDVGFQLRWPEEYRDLRDKVAEQYQGGAVVVRKVTAILRKKLHKHGLTGEVYGRQKHLYSIWTKLQRKGVTIDDLYDLVAYRVIVKKKPDCYRVLGLLHSEFRPLPGRFKDYIALPKSNGYQSLHTVVFGPYDNRIEIQIRTDKMHEVAESGVAAHWSYKTKTGGLEQHKIESADGYAWLQQMLSIHQQVDDPGQFLENIKLDLFPEEIYLFTPAGEIITLPRSATPIDFAYAVHSEVGNRCHGCKINGRMVPLRTRLNTGDTVEILTSKNHTPTTNWLEFVVTGKARYWITRWLKVKQRDLSVTMGREILEREIRKSGQGILLNDKVLQQAAASLQITTVEDLLFQVGIGRLSPLSVLHRMFPELLARAEQKSALKGKAPTAAEKTERRAVKEEAAALVGLLPNMAVHAARCCSPVPGDPIVGIITTGKWITIHIESCPNLASLATQPERWLRGVGWPVGWKNSHVARLRLMVRNQRGVLVQVSQAVSEAKASILATHLRDRQREPCLLMLEIEVQDRDHLESVMRVIQGLPVIVGVERVCG